jgi:hypothetical protein
VAVSKTLLEFRSKVEDLASINGQVGTTSAFRHLRSRVVEYCNSAYAELREELYTRKFDFYLLETALAAWPSSRADTNEQYSVIDWPSTALAIRRIDTYKNSEWLALTELDWARIRDVAPRTASSRTNRPTHYAWRDIGQPNTTSITAGKIALVPFATGGTYKISYLPRHTAIADGNDTHVFVFPSETAFMWCVWTAVAAVTVRDRNRGGRYAMSISERKQLAQRMGIFGAAALATGGQQIRRSANFDG